jgi:hypothetical protein
VIRLNQLWILSSAGDELMKLMRRHEIVRIVGVTIAIFACSLFAGAQTTLAAAPSACPVELMNLHVSDLSIHLKNTSGKRIVGLVFNVALSDATERWIWLHWLYDLSRPIQEFGWNKEIKAGESKKLSWDFNLQREHNGGVALVLTSVLFADGTRWEEQPDSARCIQIWSNKHKKGFTTEVQLPPRDE